MSTERTPEQEAVYQQYLAEATELILEGNRRISELASKETTFCSPGCSACCCQILSFQPVAFDVIWHRVANDPLLRQRLESNNALRNALLEKNKVKIEEISKMNDPIQFGNEWTRLRIPCSLLYEDKCMVYDLRPFVCASYMSLSPPRICAIEPKGYLPKSIKSTRYQFFMALNNLQLKYRIGGPELLQNLSFYLDQRLNHPLEAKKEEA